MAAHATNGYFAHGYGVNAEGVAGVAIALPQDSLAAASNPAGIAWVGTRLDAGLNWFSPSRGADIQGNGAGFNGSYDGNGRKNFFIPEFGYARRLNDQLSVGVAVYGNGGMNTQYNSNPFAAVGATGSAGVNLEQLFISPTVAYKLSEGQTLGLGLNLAYQRFSATGLGPFAFYSASPNNVSNQGDDSSEGAGLRLGWIGQLTPQWRLGATWSSKISGRFKKYSGLFVDGGSFDIPANYGVGVAYQPSEAWTLAADYQVIQYSDVASVSNPLSQLASGHFLGSPDGPGFGWSDVRVSKFGVIYQSSPQLTLRAGFSHASQAVPSSQTFLNILAPGVVVNHLTLGFTWKADEHSSWSGFYGKAFNKTVSGVQAIPPSFGGGNVNIHLKENILGVSYGWIF